MDKVLITGGTGLVGSYLVEKLMSLGFEIAVLSRKPIKSYEYKWDIDKGTIDKEALLNVAYIVHLAGAGVVDKRWSLSRKKILLDSRVASANLIFEKIKELNVTLKGFVSASGIGYYGALTTDTVFTEKDEHANDFISEICVKWEAAASQFKGLGVPVTILRIGIVLSGQGGALNKMNTPLFLSPLGSGKQFMSWIHIEDLSNLFVKAITDASFKGVFNAVSSAKDTNSSFTKTLGKVIKKVVLPVGIPSVVLKIILGELAVLLLKGSMISSDNVSKYYEFKYDNLKVALEDIYMGE